MAPRGLARSPGGDAGARDPHGRGAIERHPGFRSATLGKTRRSRCTCPGSTRSSPTAGFPCSTSRTDGASSTARPRPSPAGSGRPDEAAERLILEGRIEPLIVVAVDHGGSRRSYEYTPTRDPLSGEGGGADSYGRMLVEELKPRGIAATARGRTASPPPSPARRSAGSPPCTSASGTPTSSRASRPCPRLAGTTASLVALRRRATGRPETLVWIDVGTHEGGGQSRVRPAAPRRARPEGLARGRRHALRGGAGAVHDEVAWARRMPAGARVPLPSRELTPCGSSSRSSAARPPPPPPPGATRLRRRAGRVLTACAPPPARG